MKDKAKQENPYEIFDLNLTYYIDFIGKIQINKNDPYKQRLVGRFGNSKNTSNDIDSIVAEKIKSKKMLPDSDPKSKKSSLKFDADEVLDSINKTKNI